MSTSKNCRKRKSQRKQLVSTKTKTHKSDQPPDDYVSVTKQPIISPDGTIFYPCQYCSKVFHEKSLRTDHMNECQNKEYIFNTEEPRNAINTANNRSLRERGDDISVNSSEKPEIVQCRKQPIYEPKRFRRNDDCRTNVEENRNRKTVPDESIYDFNVDEYENSLEMNERTQSVLSDASSNVEDEQSTSLCEDLDTIAEMLQKDEEELIGNNRKCKHCHQLFENALELLRHTRDCHNFPRTILPPEEIEQYFDSPNRSFCPICQKPIKTRNFRSVFIKHLLVHTTGLTHECTVCKKKFRRRDHMRAHEKRHVV